MSQDLDERVELKTERLLLRPFAFDDVDDVLSYASDPEVARYVPLPQPYTRGDAVEFIARQVLADWSTLPLFAIVFEQHVIGSIALRIDQPNELADLGYALARPHWGQGLMPEAVRAVITWGFERYALHKVYACADTRNSRSWRVMKKLGMTREGVLRGHRKPKDEHIDDVYYGILRAEWAQCMAQAGEQPGRGSSDGRRIRGVKQ